MAFTDNMMIPEKAEHIYAAETMINFVYEPRSRRTGDNVNYLTPVKGIPRDPREGPSGHRGERAHLPAGRGPAKLHPYPALSTERRARR